VDLWEGRQKSRLADVKAEENVEFSKLTRLLYRANKSIAH